MTKMANPLLVLGTLILAACGPDDTARNGSAGADNAGSPMAAQQPVESAQPTGQVHNGSGDITEVSGDRVSISHGPVESIGWPAMTMTFQARESAMLRGLNVGDPVNFSFQKAGEAYVLTSIRRAQ